MKRQSGIFASSTIYSSSPIYYLISSLTFLVKLRSTISLYIAKVVHGEEGNFSLASIQHISVQSAFSIIVFIL